jgi:RHS repeat-associated protein
VGRKVNGTLVQGWLYQDQLRPVAQLDGSNNVVARFVYGSKPNVPDYMVTSGGMYRILSDHLGSPRAVVDVSSGNLIETLNFDEFGNETDTLAGTLPTGYVRIPFGFAGGLYDPDTGLARFGARDYDATTGRWTTKDPAGLDAEQRNVYAYVEDDPVNRIDFSGDDWRTWTFGCSGFLKYLFPWCKYVQPDPCPGLRRAEVNESDKCSAIPKTCSLPGGVMKPGTMENDPDNAGPAAQECVEAKKKTAEEQKSASLASWAVAEQDCQ